MALSEFGKAFAEARKAGDKTFEFKGKKYTTALASESEQPSVGGKATAGEYKARSTPAPRAPVRTEGSTRTSMAKEPDMEIMSKSGESRRVRNMMERAAEETNAEPDMSEYKPRFTPPTKRPVQTSDEGTTYMKKGGTVKGWGKARGARAAKVY